MGGQKNLCLAQLVERIHQDPGCRRMQGCFGLFDTHQTNRLTTLRS